MSGWAECSRCGIELFGLPVEDQATDTLCHRCSTEAATPLRLDAAQTQKMRALWHPLWARHGGGVARDCCAFCGGFLISQGGVIYEKPHAEGCGYVAICDVLGVAP